MRNLFKTSLMASVALAFAAATTLREDRQEGFALGGFSGRVRRGKKGDYRDLRSIELHNRRVKLRKLQRKARRATRLGRK